MSCVMCRTMSLHLARVIIWACATLRGAATHDGASTPCHMRTWAIRRVRSVSEQKKSNQKKQCSIAVHSPVQVLQDFHRLSRNRSSCCFCRPGPTGKAATEFSRAHSHALILRIMFVWLLRVCCLAVCLLKHDWFVNACCLYYVCFC